MPPLRILNSPELHEPTLIAAFAGWSDAGGAATAAARYLNERWRSQRIAEIDAEDFYDFTQLRPMVSYVDETRRKIDWPENSFSVHQTPERDMIILHGIEPHLHWKAYVDSVIDIIQRFNVKLVVTLGALFVEYPHTRPMRVTGTAPDPQMLDRAGLYQRGGRYEGPTGISGVLNVALRDHEIPAATIWANVPHYVSASPNPRATLALLRSLTAMLAVEVPLRRMERASEAFDAQLNEATEKNSEVSEYVRSLEERVDAELSEPSNDANSPADLPATDAIVKDIEDFLRGGSSS